ncbi:MAG: YggS family pyridoxal phosphate-dependent enzyme [Bacteroidia bacterium]
MSVAENLQKLKSQLPAHVTLCAISKTKPVSAIQEAIAAGQLDFGENKVQEMSEKQALLPSNLRWHQVGTLQRNKVKYLASYVHLIHSIDSWKLLQEIHKEAQKVGRCIPVLLQLFIAEEETKFGLDEAELRQILDHPELASLTGIKIQGLMGMATFTEDEKQIAREFAGLRKLFEQIQGSHSGHPAMDFKTLSMGMSSDYLIAVKEGSTLIRVGSAIFGDRTYPA